jgi:predicted nucleic acid-binding protein
VAQKRGMNGLFADTFYWIALTDLNDSSHRLAMSVTSARIDSPIVTTDEVLAEYLTFFATGAADLRHKAVITAYRILKDPGVRVVPQSRESFLAGMALYSTRLDKGYSLTDCISMQTMGHEGLTEALTNDRHFEQEGFRALFRNS